MKGYRCVNIKNHSDSAIFNLKTEVFAMNNFNMK